MQGPKPDQGDPQRHDPSCQPGEVTVAPRHKHQHDRRHQDGCDNLNQNADIRAREQKVLHLVIAPLNMAK